MGRREIEDIVGQAVRSDLFRVKLLRNSASRSEAIDAFLVVRKLEPEERKFLMGLTTDNLAEFASQVETYVNENYPLEPGQF